MSSPIPVALQNTESYIIPSSCVPQEFSISIGLPPSYADLSKLFPVLYILDGNLEFPLVKSVCDLLWLGRQISEVILVGVGYPVSHRDETVPLLTRDLTPTVSGEGAGGSGDFLQFLRRELIPFVDANYRTNPSVRALLGDSRGGLFGLYAMFTAPEAFNRYLIGSPSMWWDDQVIFEFERRFAGQHSDLDAHLFMAAGEREDPSMVANIIKMTDLLILRRYPSLTLDVNILEGETHYSIIPAAVSHGVRSILST